LKENEWLSILEQEGKGLCNLARIKFEKKNFTIDNIEMKKFRQEVSQTEIQLLNEDFKTLFDDESFTNEYIVFEKNSPLDLEPNRRFFASLRKSLSFGYEFGKEISKLFFLSKKQTHDAAWACALAHTIGSSFDIILDDKPELFPEAKKIISLAYSRTFSKNKEEEFNLEKMVDFDPVLKIFQVTNNAFSVCIKKEMEGSNPEVLRELEDVLGKLLNAEIVRDINLENSELRFDAIYQHQRIRNSYPFWGECLVCMLYNSWNINVNEWKETMLRFGDVFWIIDDIVDFVDDLKSKHWNYLVLMLSQSNGRNLSASPPDIHYTPDIYSDLMYHDIIGCCVNTIHMKIFELKKIYEDLGLSGDKIVKLTKSYMFSQLWKKNQH